LTLLEKDQLIKNFDNPGKVKFAPKPPTAFTEKGLYMLATILKGTTATQTTIAIVEIFAKIKNLTRNIKEIDEVKGQKNKKNLMRKSGEIISEILGDDLSLSETETSFELNFAVLKLRHTVKKRKDQ